jgi:hypothetical protein
MLDSAAQYLNDQAQSLATERDSFYSAGKAFGSGPVASAFNDFFEAWFSALDGQAETMGSVADATQQCAVIYDHAERSVLGDIERAPGAVGHPDQDPDVGTGDAGGAGRRDRRVPDGMRELPDSDDYLNSSAEGLWIEVEPPGHVEYDDLREIYPEEFVVLPAPDDEGCLWYTTASVPASALAVSADVIKQTFHRLAEDHEGIALEPG